MTKEELIEKFDQFYKESWHKTVWYFIKRIEDIESSKAEDLASLTLDQVWQSIEKQYKKDPDISTDKWLHLLSKIRKARRIDYKKSQNSKSKTIIVSLDKELENDTEDTITTGDLIGTPDKEIEKINNETIKPLPWQLRLVLLSKQRSLQEVFIIWLTPSCKELKELIENTFPFVIKRYRSRKTKLWYELLETGEEINQEQSDEININFSQLIFSLAKKLKVDDPVGIKALKILFLSIDPLNDWAIHLSGKIERKDYSSFDENGKLCNKKHFSRPYSNLIRDVLAFRDGLRNVKQFISIAATEYLECPVSIEYIEKFYHIGCLNKSIVNKQLNGRTNKIGLRKQIQEYDKIIKETIDEIKKK